MDKILKEKTEQWMTLERKTLEQRKKAEQFYEEEMMEHIVREYIRNNKSKSVLRLSNLEALPRSENRFNLCAVLFQLNLTGKSCCVIL